ncbi:MAG: hypothetical protein M3Y13_09590 [Armatimonadota bacterium]|nr:hypothetical protein [Armatimonadota bacterium]
MTLSTMPVSTMPLVDKWMPLVDKCRNAAESLSRERGGFSLLALFEHDEVPGKWDLLFSAPWVKPGRQAIQSVVDALAPELSPEDWQSIVSVIPLDPSSAQVQGLVRRYGGENWVVEVANAVLDGIFVSHGFIISANTEPVEARDRQPAAA